MTLADPTPISAAAVTPPRPARSRHRRVAPWAGLAVAACVFAAIAPMLPRFELSNGIEELYAATVMEMNRGGPWVVPTLYGRPRIAKPPLPAWAGGLAVSADTMAGVGSPDPAARAVGFSRLAWQVRWPALLAGCLMLAATFDLGRTVGGRRVGVTAAVVAGTSFLFLRFARLATGDVYLGLFVAAANATAARAVLGRQRWVGVVGTGAMLGLAFMCKGPVCLVQTLLPLLVWAGIVRVTRRGTARRSTTMSTKTSTSASDEAGRPAGGWLVPCLLAIGAFLLIALPWPIAVLRSLNGAWNLWRREITREGATNHEYGPVWSYVSLLPNLLPWLPAFLLGVGLVFRRNGIATARRTEPDATSPTAELIDANNAVPIEAGTLGYASPADRTAGPGRVGWWGGLGKSVRRATAHRGYLLALVLLVVPLAVMSCVRDKNERYLLPVLPAAAVLAGRGLVALLVGVRRRRPFATAAFGLQLGLAAAVLVGVPAAGLTKLAFARVDGRPWFGPPLGLGALAAAVGATLAMFALARRGRPATAVALAAGGMLAAGALFLWGYKDDPAGRAEMRPIAEDILARHRDPVVAYVDAQKPLPPDLPIYLNRVVRNVKPTVAAAATTRPTADGWPDGREPDVLVMLQREGAPPPTLPGWRSVAREPSKKRFWHVMEREGSSVK